MQAFVSRPIIAIAVVALLASCHHSGQMIQTPPALTDSRKIQVYSIEENNGMYILNGKDVQGHVSRYDVRARSREMHEFLELDELNDLISTRNTTAVIYEDKRNRTAQSDLCLLKRRTFNIFFCLR